MRQYEYPSYEEYVAEQIRTNKRKLNVVWAYRENISLLSAYLLTRITPTYGICHGTRNGKEQRWFREYLGCPVVGTEISDTATQFPWTVQWDFHRRMTEWVGIADFVYSNSLDHAYDPIRAITTWAEQRKPGGFLMIEHSDHDGEEYVTPHDPFGASLEEIVEMCRPFGDVDVIELPRKKPTVNELHCVIVR